MLCGRDIGDVMCYQLGRATHRCLLQETRRELVAAQLASDWRSDLETRLQTFNKNKLFIFNLCFAKQSRGQAKRDGFQISNCVLYTRSGCVLPLVING